MQSSFCITIKEYTDFLFVNVDARLIKYCGRRLLGHENFRVTLATTNMYPILSARTASSTTLVNYNASPEMLREELLDRAFSRVMPQLYLEKKKVLRAIQQHKETLKVGY